MPRLLRPLPWAIAVMMALLGVKLAGFVQVLRVAAPAYANAPASHAAPQPAHPPTPAPPVPAPAATPQPADPPVSEAERAVLQELRARRVQLDARTQTLETREAVLAAAERRLADRVDQLSALQARLEQLEGGRRERDEANWRGLVKTYETMRPRDAAAIMNELDGPVLLQVLDRMKEAKAAPILAAMQPDRARAATAQLAQSRTRGTAAPSLGLPEPGAKP